MTYNVFAKLYATLIEPIMYYGAGIWGTREHKLLNTVQNKAARLFLGTGKNASNLATQADMGWSSPTFKQKTEVFRLYMKIHEINDNRISKKIHVWSYIFHQSWESIVLKQIDKFDIEHILSIDTSVKNRVDLIKEILFTFDEQEWKLKLFNDRNQINGNKMRTYRLYKDSLNAESYVCRVKYRDQRRIMSKIRSGSLPLHIETGRYTRPYTPLEDRLCTYCESGSIEDEMHFLLHCSFYDDLRYELYESAFTIESNFYTFCDTIN